MNIDAVKEGIVSGATQAAGAIKDAAIWMGRKISEGCSALADLIAKCCSAVAGFASRSASAIGDFVKNTVVPFFKNDVGPALKTAGQHTVAFLRSPAGLAVVTGATGLGLGIGAEFAKNKALAVGLRVGAVASIAASGVAVGLGISNGFTTQII